MLLLRKALLTIKEEGLRSFIVKTIAHIIEATICSNSADWYHLDINDYIQHQKHTTNDDINITVTFNDSQATMDWLYELKSEINWLWNKKEINTAKKYSHYYILIKLNGQKAGCIKVGGSRVYITDFDREIVLPENTAFIYDTFIHADFRGHRLATRLVNETLTFLAIQGYSYVWCHIPRWNHASIKTYKKCGFLPVTYIRYFRFMFWSFYSKHPEKVFQNLIK